MRKLLFFLLLLHTTSYGQDKNNYHIELDIKGAKEHKFYLMPIYGGLHNRDNIKPVDSVFPKADTFSFSGTFNDYQYYTLVTDTSRMFYQFILDTSAITIKGYADSIERYSFSPQNDMLHDFGKKTNSIINSMNNFGSNGDQKEYDSIQKVFKDTLVHFAKTYPNSYGIFNMAIFFMDSDIEFGRRIFPLFSEGLRHSKEGKQTHYMLYQYDTSQIVGGTFPIVKGYDTNYESTIFKPEKDKIYLIDYWASWCHPCIEKLPELKKLAANYRNKKFEIVSLSIDKNYDAWVKAIKKHDIPWKNYSSLNGTDSEDASYFNITSIPYTILVGTDNKIIKLNPTEEEVEKYLKEM